MVKTFKDLVAYKKAFELMMRIFETAKRWPREERYNLTDQILRSSRSVCGNIAEAWRRRKYKNVFVHQLNEAAGSLTETQVWLDVALACKYIVEEEHSYLYDGYEEVGRMLTGMENKAEVFSKTNS
jgi:four helix bundle protein